VMKFLFFECRNKIGAACRHVLRLEWLFYSVEGPFEIRQKFERGP